MDQHRRQSFSALARSVELAKARAGDLVFNHLRSAIIRGDLREGDRLSEEEVAEQACLSRTPVREAFKRLEAEGLIRRLPGVGMEVIGITHEDFMEIFEIRRLLEPAAAEKAAELATPEAAEALEALVTRLERALELGDDELAIACHTEWTVTLFQMCGNKRLASLLATYEEYIRKSSLVSLKAQGKDAVSTHRNLTEAIVKRDPKKARALAETHMEFVYQIAKSGKQDNSAPPKR